MLVNEGLTWWRYGVCGNSRLRASQFSVFYMCSRMNQKFPRQFKLHGVRSYQIYYVQWAVVFDAQLAQFLYGGGRVCEQFRTEIDLFANNLRWRRITFPTLCELARLCKEEGKSRVFECDLQTRLQFVVVFHRAVRARCKEIQGETRAPAQVQIKRRNSGGLEGEGAVRESHGR